jgi:hypothetical protein
MNCTLFAISEGDLEPSLDSLPAYEDTGAVVVSRTDTKSTLALGSSWVALHVALGEHGPEHPLGFLEAGGESRPEFLGPTSSGRYFPAPYAVQILAALAGIAQPSREIERVRIFVADLVARGLGLIVYQFR